MRGRAPSPRPSASSISARSASSSWIASASSCTHMPSTSAPGSSAATFASSAAISSSWSSPTFTTASTGLLVRRKCGLQQLARVRRRTRRGRSASRRSAPCRRPRARRPRRPASDRRGPPSGVRLSRPSTVSRSARASSISTMRRCSSGSSGPGDVVVGEGPQHEHDGVDLADAAQEPVAEPLALAGPLDQTADVDDLHRGVARRSCSSTWRPGASRRWSGTFDMPTFGSFVANA